MPMLKEDDCAIRGNLMIPVEKIRQLPTTHTATIPPEYRDEMGHMNIQWYVALFDRSAWGGFELLGADLSYLRQHETGMFALQQHIHYLAEVQIGETVSMHIRFVARSEKRLHKMHFMINESTNMLASTMEVIAGHIDMRVRRMAAFTPSVAAKLDEIIARHQALDWDAPLCGVLAP